MNDRGRPSGEAFVALKSEDERSKALAFNKTSLDQRWVAVVASSGYRDDYPPNRSLGHDRKPSSRRRSRSRSRSRSPFRSYRRSPTRSSSRYSPQRSAEYSPSRPSYSSDSYHAPTSYPDPSAYSAPVPSSSHPLYDNPSAAENDTCVHITNIPSTATADDITDFFQQTGVIPTKIHRKPQGTEAYMEFLSAEEADIAMRKNKVTIF